MSPSQKMRLAAQLKKHAGTLEPSHRRDICLSMAL